MHKIRKFRTALNEADLEGNIGIPGEEGSGRESWLRKKDRDISAEMRGFEQANRADIMNFGRLINKSKELQRGHEAELSELTVEAFRQIFASFLEGVDLEFKIGTSDEVKAMMDETETEPVDIEQLEDEKIINQVHKRKILRTIQQGVALNSKTILNSDIFVDGIIEILGEAKAMEYIGVLNKIADVAKYFDATIPTQQQMGMWQTRSGFSGACDLQFPEETPEEKEKKAQDLLDKLKNGEDIIGDEEMEEFTEGLNMKIIAIGVDLSVLIHEAIKGIYKMPVQASLEALYGGAAEKVLQNTESLFDELQEIKYGRQMQKAFFDVIAKHPKVLERIDSMRGEDDRKTQIFLERLNYTFFSYLAQVGQDDAREFLTIVNAILSDSPEAAELCEPLIISSLQSIESSEEYERSLADWESGKTREEEPSFESPASEEPGDMSREEVLRAIDAALDAGDYEEIERLRKMLGEGIQIARFGLGRLFESRGRR